MSINLLAVNPLGIAMQLAGLLKKDPKDPRIGHLLEHSKKIVEDLGNPMPFDQELTLPQVYVVPTARFYHSKAQGEMGKRAKNLAEAGDETEITKEDDSMEDGQTPNLTASLLQTLCSSTDPIIIHGDPGHGKTSSVRMLAKSIAAWNQIEDPDQKPDQQVHVLMYEFKHLRQLDDYALKVLSGVTDFIEKENFFYGLHTVLILDGMDERQMTDGTDNALKDFIRNLFKLSEDINKRTDGSRMNLIFTGRSQFVSQIKSAFSTGHYIFEVEDFSEEQVNDWLEKYNAAKPGRTTSLTLAELQEKHLQELISQPILLTIAALLLTDEQGKVLMGQLPTGEELTRGKIYQTIIEWTFHKKWHSDSRPAVEDLDEPAFTRMLQVIGFILFREGTEEILTKTLSECLKTGNDCYQLPLKKPVEKHCEDLAVAFFFTGAEKENKCFSFIHKSIKDYLAVEAMLLLTHEVVTEIPKANFEREQTQEKSCKKIARELYFLLGKASLSAGDHLGFLRDAIAIHRDKAAELFQPLELFFTNALQGHPYLLEHAGQLYQEDNPIKIEANVLSNLFYFLTEIYQSFSEGERKERFKETEGRWRPFKWGAHFSQFIHFLDSTALFRYANHRFNLREADLREADLSGAILIRANLMGANLMGANLRRANLRRANLSGADLMRVDLREADLSGADLSGVNLSGVNLSGVNLSRADLMEANLSGANLRRADLSGADLSGAYLKLADLSGADLARADLWGAIDLTQKQLNSARIDERTRLPSYLSRTEQKEQQE